jgi:hypothetical protein
LESRPDRHVRSWRRTPTSDQIREVGRRTVSGRRARGIGKFDPDGCMIARSFEASYLAFDAGRNKTIGDRGAQQQMIDAKPDVV